MAAEVASARRAAGRPLRRDGLVRAQVPARRQGRPEPDPRRGLRRFRLALRRAARAGRAVAARLRVPTDVRDWARGLGVETFVGSSGRVFPADMKAAPLMRAWLRRLREQGVRFHMRHRCLGWNEDGSLRFATPDGERGRAGRCRGAGTRRRQLGETRLGRRLGAVAGGARRVGGAAGAVELRLRRRVERTPARALRRRTGEVGRAAAAGRRGRTHRRIHRHRATASKAARSTRCRRGCATRSPRRRCRARSSTSRPTRACNG